MEEPGPFERVLQPDGAQPRDRAAVIIVAVAIVLGLLLLVLILPPVSILKSDDNGGVSGPVTTKIRDELPPLPNGFEAVSALFDLESQQPVDRAARLTLPLSSQVAGEEELFLYTYQNGAWRELGKATPVANGASASGDVRSVPSNVAVLRKAAPTARTVVGGLPADGELDEGALGALTTLSPAGYSPSADGSIEGELPSLPDNLEVALAPTISATDATAADALREILSSADGRTAHVEAIAALVNDNGYAGVNLDYRGIDPEQGGDFVSFITELSTQLLDANKALTLTLPAPLRQASGWDTLGYDWEKLAPQVDAISVVSNADPGSSYSALSEALGYLVPRVGSSKLLLTIGSLSRERGSDGVRSLTLTEALTLASTPAVQGDAAVAAGASVQAFAQNLNGNSGGAPLHWDDGAKAVSFGYTGAGGQRTVWLANAFSASFLLDLAGRYRLKGIAIEDVSTHAADAGVTAAAAQFASTGSVQLVQPNGSLLEPRWTASEGKLQSDRGPSVTWQAPDASGDYVLTLIVSDGIVRLGQELQLLVQASGQP